MHKEIIKFIKQSVLSYADGSSDGYADSVALPFPHSAKCKRCDCEGFRPIESEKH